MALMRSVSASGRWSSQRMTFLTRSLSCSSAGWWEKCGAVTGTGSSVSWVKTASEQVASKPMPLTDWGGTDEEARIRRTHLQMARQMSVVDCSWEGELAGRCQNKSGMGNLHSGREPAATCECPRWLRL